MTLGPIDVDLIGRKPAPVLGFKLPNVLKGEVSFKYGKHCEGSFL